MTDYFSNFDKKCRNDPNHVHSLPANLTKERIVEGCRAIMTRQWTDYDRELVKILAGRDLFAPVLWESIRHVSNFEFLAERGISWHHCSTILHGIRDVACTAFLLRNGDGKALVKDLRCDKTVIFSLVDHLANVDYRIDTFETTIELFVWYGADVTRTFSPTRESILQYIYGTPLATQVKKAAMKIIMKYDVDLSNMDSRGRTLYQCAVVKKDWAFVNALAAKLEFDGAGLWACRNLPPGPMYLLLEEHVRRNREARACLKDAESFFAHSGGVVDFKLRDGRRTVPTAFIKSHFDVVSAFLARWDRMDSTDSTDSQCTIFDDLPCEIFDTLIRWLVVGPSVIRTELRCMMECTWVHLYAVADEHDLTAIKDTVLAHVKASLVRADAVHAVILSAHRCNQHAIVEMCVERIVRMWEHCVGADWYYDIPRDLRKRIQMTVTVARK